MIRVNLLPVRAAKKKESIRFQITVASLATGFVVALSMILFLIAVGEVRSLRSEFAVKEVELAELRKKTGKLANIENQKKLVEAKLDSIRKLEEGRTGPLEMFKGIGEAIPEKVWITVLSENAHAINFNGFAATEDDISEFLRGIQSHSELGRAELIVAQRDMGAVKDRELFSFKIRIDR